MGTNTGGGPEQIDLALGDHGRARQGVAPREALTIRTVVTLVLGQDGQTCSDLQLCKTLRSS